MGRKIRLAVLSCLFGTLSMGHAEWWGTGEDRIIIEFIKASQENLEISWKDCADAVNQRRMELGFESTRTVEACRHRWDSCLKKHNPKLRFRGEYAVLRRNWKDDENRLFVECVDQRENETFVDWEAVSRIMRINRWNRSASECRAHWKVIAPRAGSLRTTAPVPAVPDQVPGDLGQVPGGQGPFEGLSYYGDNPGFGNLGYGDWDAFEYPSAFDGDVLNAPEYSSVFPSDENLFGFPQ